MMRISDWLHVNRPLPKNNIPPKNMRGMTLIELIVTVSIVGIVTAVAVPSFRTMLGKNRVDGLTNELGAFLNFARSEAIKRGKPVTACKTANPAASTPSCSTNEGDGWQNGWLVFVDCSTSWGSCPGTEAQGTLNTNDVLLKANQPSASSATIDAGNYTNYLTYLPSGLSNVNGSATDGTFTICMEGIKRTIVINTIGRINIRPEETC